MLRSGGQQQAVDGRNAHIFASGQGLAPGQGSFADGLLVCTTQCLACHGPQGSGGTGGRLAGGLPMTANNPRPEKTIGQFWPYATTLFDTIRRAMPMQAPGTLRDAQTDALCTCVLHLNAIIGAEAVIDAQTLPRVQMPNRGGFVVAPRADSALR